MRNVAVWKMLSEKYLSLWLKVKKKERLEKPRKMEKHFHHRKGINKRTNYCPEHVRRTANKRKYIKIANINWVVPLVFYTAQG